MFPSLTKAFLLTGAMCKPGQDSLRTWLFRCGIRPGKADLVLKVLQEAFRSSNGIAVDYSEEEATRILSEPAVTAIANMNQGNAEATAWGCDLTYDYVKINADYRS